MNEIASNKLPVKLYRYRSNTDANLEALYKARLYLSTPIYFNDPFDNLFYVNENNFLDLIKTELESKMQKFMQFVLTERPQYKLPASIIDSAIQDSSNRQEFFNTILTNLNDVKQKLQKNMGLICFSEDNRSNLMWSHYADYHKGFVLEYNVDEINRAICFDKNGNAQLSQKMQLKKVCYSDKRVDLGPYMYHYLPKHVLDIDPQIFRQSELMDPPNTLLYQTIIRKASDWSYEKEWRLLPLNFDILLPPNTYYIEVKPAAIYLGVMMPEEDRKKIKHIAKKLDIKTYNIYIDNKNPEFSLQIT